ncbi:choice-of-anchor D domain-containing protein [Paraherbaspirillum soli]|uniref:Choice-of-anchor D domain-containing protein n=1 Tax=Paraherbaspirillum soli TaxID=631222 RepID=A0ABW0MEX4_9BURK
MRTNQFNTRLLNLVKAGLAASILCMASGASLAQSVSLTAKAVNATLPDGQVVPMWGFNCSAAAVAPAKCAAANPGAGLGWSPVVITTPPGNLIINLTNNLPVPPGAAAGVPTSLVIVGQLGGGLGTTATTTASPVHPTQSTTWPIAGSATGPQFTPPAQPPRVQSFATEVVTGATKSLSWTNLKPGTYLIESGTHPSIQGPMGLYGVLVVTTPPSGPNRGLAYTGVNYDGDVPLVLGEIDPAQNAAVAAAVATAGFSETKVWSGQPGGCGNPASPASVYRTCYPPAVNYDPRYYTINGVSFDRTNQTKSQFAVTAPAATGKVLVRLVNAGLRMHVPTVVGAQTGSPAVSGFALIAEDGNLLPGTPRVQSEVFLAAGKTYDVLINAPAAGSLALPVFDRQLSLSTNNQRDGGMQAYISINGGALPQAAINQNAIANPDTYYLVPGNTLTISDPAKGVIANDIRVYGVQVATPPAAGSLTLNPDGTFTYVPNAGTTSDSFIYKANGNAAITAKVTLAACTAGNGCLSGPPTAANASYTSNIASKLSISPSGVLAYAKDPAGLPMTAALVGAPAGGTVTLNADGSFIAAPTTAPVGAATATVSFQYKAVNSQKTASAPATVTVTFKGGSGVAVAVKDAITGTLITDYRWIIEEDRSFQVDPACQTTASTRPATCPPLPVPSVGTNFHTSYMPVVAQGCVGKIACESGQKVFDPATNSHLPAVCDIGNGVCRTTATQQTAVDPRQVALDPTKHYYISVLPGDAGNPFATGAGAPRPVDPSNPSGPTRQFSIALDCPSGPAGADFAPGTGTCGHAIGGAAIAPAQATVNIALQQTPLQTAKVSVFVFEDDSPLNGEVDVGGGIMGMFGTTKEPGLGGFEIKLFDDAGGTGDPTGQMSYDMFNMPLSNSLQGMIDPATGLNACPISSKTDGLVGMIPTCPKFESDGKTLSPLVGQAVIANLMPGRYGVVATPAADRIGRGEEWLQTNTLDGQKAHDAFIRVGGPSYFQEFGPAGFHVSIGFANPKIINDRLPGVCANTTCNNSVNGRITNLHYSRPPNENLYGAGNRTSLSFTVCYVSIGDPDGDDIAFTKCNADGTFSVSGLPDGTFRITVFDQWNDQIVDGLAKAVQLKGGQTLNIGDIPVLQWHTNLYTRTYMDLNGDGVSQASEPGLALVPTNVRYRDGSFSNFNSTDLNGYAVFNEVFPLFNWYVVETDTTRFKQTGVHVVYDAGGPPDGTPGGGTSTIAANYANTLESPTAHLPAAQRIPGAVYCNDADCNDRTGTNPSTGRIDPPWETTMGWQGFSGQNSFIEFGKAPYGPTENGGIRGEVIYASTRPFDDPAMLVHTSWTPNVPNVTVNLYQKGTAADGSTSLTLVDSTVTSSWDAWAQGFRSDGVPNMNCPGQEASDPYFYTLKNTTQWLDPQHRPLSANSQFKCYDGMHAFNQLQPAPYDGMYRFPSVTATSPTTGKPTASNCTICVPNPSGDGSVMLPAGTYVAEVIVPPGYELVKEEDKNILIGDNFIAPVTQQFGGLGNIFIMPDQAAVNATYNANNAQNPTTNFGASAENANLWPCVGALRIVPDYISLFPGSQEVAPFAGASRHLCDRKEIKLSNQMQAQAKFWIFSSMHVASHYTGFMLDDFSSEFDPYSPQFGEKFAPPNLPISFKDFAGNEMSRVYADQWGIFNGMTYSTWEVNPPNPTGYAPTMMVACMNDPGPIPDPAHPGQTMTDPNFNPAYSQFCYEIPFMPGQTQYMDTPVVPVQAFASGYNPPDCAYPDATPAISKVTGDSSNGGAGPWVSLPGHTLTITALGDQSVPNHAYTGPGATIAPYNQKTVTRHYGFGASQGTGSVTIGGVNAHVSSWSDAQIQVLVPGLSASQSSCPIQQRGVMMPAFCGELVITADNGKKSIDAVTVTIGGKAPTYVNGENGTNNAIQTAIDSAAPGDLIMVGPGTYKEMLLMWKPLRLQGVGAASVKVDANTHPSGKMDAWRREVNCLFGVSLSGGMISPTVPYDPSGTYTCAPNMLRQVDVIPIEPAFGWDSTLNGNLGELLMEPTLMGAYEGAGITVLGKGVPNVTIGGVVQADPACITEEGGTCVPLTASNSDCTNYPGNFLCNPARIDGISFTNSSQGGGGIFAHGWNHNLEISNNRVFSNAGTLSGGITIGQVEVPAAVMSADGLTQLAFGFNNNVKVHHNAVTSNSSYGDEINSTTPSSAGGVTFCTGADSYHFNYNWVCGNMSSGDGGGVAHFGFSYNGDISYNWVMFNQSNNPTLPTYGGGIIAQGVPPDGTFCENATVDQDCAPALGDGAGPGLKIDSNLIIGNTAESGKGGGLRLQNINGTDVQRNPGNPAAWYHVDVTNNIVANNVAGWAGGGVSLQDAVSVNFINNTIVSNDSTATAGVLFNTAAAAQANVGPPNCTTVGAETTCNPTTTSQYEPAGLETARHTSNFIAAFTTPGVACPAGQANCTTFSNPLMTNNLFWQNRSFYITVGGLNPAIPGLQNLVTLNPTLNQSGHQTGYCDPNAVYWDIGAFGDTGPANHGSGLTLNPQYSILTDVADYPGANNLGSNPTVISQYCNGSRVPPEGGGIGFAVPPGISDAVLPNPLFGLMPSATPDEGNQWINMTYGPLSLSNSSIASGGAGYGMPLGNYAIASGSPAINHATATNAPNHDIFGTTRPQAGSYDIGAVEFVAGPSAVANVTPASVALGNAVVTTTSGPQTLTLHNTGNATMTGIGLTFTGPFARAAAGGSCNATLAAGSTCTINVVFSPTAAGPANGSVAISSNVAVSGSPVSLTGTGVAAIVRAAFAPATWSPSSPRGVPGQTQNFTLTNTGNVALTGIAQGSLGGASPADYAIIRSASTCGPAGGGQTQGLTSLAPGSSCVVAVQFRPLTGDPANSVRNATVSVTDGAGTQSAALSGTAR